MVHKIIDAVQAKPGATVMIDGVACVVKSNDVSKTGKHGHAKCRIEAIGVIDGKKKVLVISGHDRFDVPTIDKGNAQILSVMGDKASIMDLKSFENFELPIFEELKGTLGEGDQVEYWNLEGIKFIKRKV
jgi:translation initiation factor 5A